MPETNDSPLHVNDVSEARAKFEQERMTRRSALRKLGMTSGMALFSLFAVDGLARIAVKKLAEHKETNAIADSIAHDFKDMGVAFAAGGDNDYYDGGPCTPSAGNTNWCGAGGHIRERRHNLEECQGCVTQKGNEKQTCTDQHATCLANGINTVQDCNTNLTNCNKTADNGYTACCIGFRCTC